MMRRVIAAASAFLVAIVGLSLTTASAASFMLSAAPTAYFDEVSACADGTVNGRPVIQTTAAAGSADVAVSDIPSDCYYLPLEVFVYNAAAELIAVGSDTSRAGDIEVTVNGPTATGDSVLLRIGGWVFPTTWTAPVPSNPTPPLGPVTCYELDANGNVVLDGTGQGVPCVDQPYVHNFDDRGEGVYFEYRRAERSAEPVLLVFDISDPEYPAYTDDLTQSCINSTGHSGVVNFRAGYALTQLPIIEIIYSPYNEEINGRIGVVPRNPWHNPGLCPN